MRVKVPEKIRPGPGPGDFDWVSSFDKSGKGGLIFSTTEPNFDVHTRSKSLFGDKYRDLLHMPGPSTYQAVQVVNQIGKHSPKHAIAYHNIDPFDSKRLPREPQIPGPGQYMPEKYAPLNLGNQGPAYTMSTKSGPGALGNNITRFEDVTPGPSHYSADVPDTFGLAPPPNFWKASVRSKFLNQDLYASPPSFRPASPSNKKSSSRPPSSGAPQLNTASAAKGDKPVSILKVRGSPRN